MKINIIKKVPSEGFYGRHQEPQCPFCGRILHDGMCECDDFAIAYKKIAEHFSLPKVKVYVANPVIWIKAVSKEEVSEAINPNIGELDGKIVSFYTKEYSKNFFVKAIAERISMIEVSLYKTVDYKGRDNIYHTRHELIKKMSYDDYLKLLQD